MPTYMVQGKLVTLTAVRADVGSGPIAIEPIEKFHHGDLVRIDGGAALQLGDQLCTANLRLSLGAGKRVPAAPAPAGHRIMVVEDDCPTAGGTFADVAFHFFRLLLS